MNTTTITSIGALILVVVVIVGVYILSIDQSNTKVTAVEAPLTVVDSSYNFGEIDIFGGKVRTTYTLVNEGVEDVTITSAATSCMCTEGEIDGLVFGMHGQNSKEVTIPAGSEQVLTAIFDPLAHGPEGTGPITRELFLETNSSITPEITVRFSGTVVKKIEN